MLTRAFVVLWIAMAVAVSGIAMVSPLLPVYVREELSGPEIAVALSFSAIAISQMVASPIVGRLGDRFGSKPFIVAGFFVYGAGAVGYIFAPTWELVVVFRALSGIGAAAIFPMAMAYVGRLAPPGFEGRYMGAFSISWIAGFGIGPLIGGSVRDIVSTDAAFGVMALMLFVVGAATFVLLPARPSGGGGGEDEDEEGLFPGLPIATMLRRPIVQAATGGQVIVSLGWGAGYTFIAVYVVSEDGLNTGSATFVGLLIASRAVVTAITQLYTGPLADRTSRIMLSAVGFTIAGLAQFVVPDVPGSTIDLNLFGADLVIVPWLLVLFLHRRHWRGNRVPRAASDLRGCRSRRRHGLGHGHHADGRRGRLPRWLAARRPRRRGVRRGGRLPLRRTRNDRRGGDLRAVNAARALRLLSARGGRSRAARA